MRILLDSNILIYSAAPGAEKLQAWLGNQNLYVSHITVLEVLGYHKLTDREHAYLYQFINLCSSLPIELHTITKAVELRREKSMSFGDSIIAATAISEGLVLATANLNDFQHLQEIQLINPLDLH